MAHAHSHSHDHSHSHGHDHSHAHHGHHHDPATPHPAQIAHWSILRMTVPARLVVALGVSVCLWGVVWLAMR
jgi:hypothetical protein